ncbi:MAG: glycosyltransferase [Geobacter sp.]|nr:glycosyltransferase [Geobacter sp.]
MQEHLIDIIVPVWNALVETRNCLVSLIEHAQSARLILVDNGSERETERMLQEFAEGLGERALLMRNEINNGFVKAVNQGLARAEAPFLGVVRNTSVVTSGWLEPMIEAAGARLEAGIIVPRLVEGTGANSRRQRTGAVSITETGAGSFAALLIRKKLYERIGGFDEEMDGAGWCLKDYSRKAYRADFNTLAVHASPVFHTEPVLLGSAQRREQQARKSAEDYLQRWGTEQSFCMHFPKETDPQVFLRKLELLLTGARQGHAFNLLVPYRLARQLRKQGIAAPHTGIVFEQMPLFGVSSAIARTLQRLMGETPSCQSVTGIDGIPFPGIGDAINFYALEQKFRQAEAEIYGH